MDTIILNRDIISFIILARSIAKFIALRTRGKVFRLLAQACPLEHPEVWVAFRESFVH